MRRRRPHPEDMYQHYKELANRPFKLRVPYVSVSDSTAWRVSILFILLPLIPVWGPAQLCSWFPKKKRMTKLMYEESSRMRRYKVGRVYSN